MFRSYILSKSAVGSPYIARTSALTHRHGSHMRSSAGPARPGHLDSDVADGRAAVCGVERRPQSDHRLGVAVVARRRRHVQLSAVGRKVQRERPQAGGVGLCQVGQVFRVVKLDQLREGEGAQVRRGRSLANYRPANCPTAW